MTNGVNEFPTNDSHSFDNIIYKINHFFVVVVIRILPHKINSVI